MFSSLTFFPSAFEVSVSTNTGFLSEMLARSRALVNEEVTKLLVALFAFFCTVKVEV